MKYRIYALFFLFTLTSCVTTAGKSDGHVYYSPSNEFKVTRPDSIRGFNNVTDIIKPGVQIVNFSLDNKYWDTFGLFTVAWFMEISDKTNTKEKFNSVSINNIKDIVATKYQNRGAFKLLKTEEKNINNKNAVYFEATGKLDGIQTDWFGTVLEFKNRIAIVSVVIPPKSHWKKQPKDYYNDFVNSLEQL